MSDENDSDTDPDLVKMQMWIVDTTGDRPKEYTIQRAITPDLIQATKVGQVSMTIHQMSEELIRVYTEENEP